MSCVPIAHDHALMVASNLQRRGSHSTVVETSQSYKTTNIGVGCDALGWPDKILRWVISIEPGAVDDRPQKCPSITTRLLWDALGVALTLRGRGLGLSGGDTHIARATQARQQKKVNARNSIDGQRSMPCVGSEVGGEVTVFAGGSRLLVSQ
jgi:hypothetical protein